MTTPTPGSSSPAPSTVIGHRPEDLEPARVLEHAVSGHQEIVAAIAAHAEHDKVMREAARQQASGGPLPGG